MQRVRRASSTAPWILLGVAFVAMALLAREAFAQDARAVAPFDLVGTVVSDAGQPLVGAFVAMEGSDWGSLTDDRGRFRLSDMDPGRVALTVEQLGYDTLRWVGTIQAGEPVEIRMTPRPILLEGLNVVTDRFESRRRATATSVQAFDRRALATSPQSNALSFVSARMGLSEVRCPGAWGGTCLRVRGRTTEPTVWVDEMPVLGGVDYLAALTPYELYMIEVYAGGRHIRAYTNHFMERAAKDRFRPYPFIF